jgi:hypothetical protein
VLGAADPGHERVRGLDVAVDEPVRVGLVERPGQLSDQRQRPLGLERTLRVQELRQVDPVDVAHGDVQLPVDLARLVDRDHARVVDRRRHSRLTQETRAECRVVAVVRRQDLQCDLAPETGVGRAVHDAHAATTEHPLDPIGPDVTADPWARV